MLKLKNKKILIIIVVFLFYSFTASVEAPKVVINEIAWMGTNVSHNDEWTIPANEPFLCS